MKKKKKKFKAHNFIDNFDAHNIFINEVYT